MKRNAILVAVMVIFSIFIAWLDTQNNAEETGVEYAYVLMIASVFGLLWGAVAAKVQVALLLALLLTTPAIISGFADDQFVTLKLVVAFAGLNLVGRFMRRSNQ
jgi:hypothetical protein